MANLLIVTEKPSVAKSIASALGVKENEKHEGYIEGFSDYFGIKVWVTWCLGHLVQMSNPEAYDPKYAKWRLEDLPILPEEFRYEVIPETEKQFRIVAELMNLVGKSEQDKREKSTLSQGNKFLVPVERLICATDAGREGELIFRLVYHKAGCTKPFDRLWISSMEDSAIREGFHTLRPSFEYDNLYQAALCRERADWIVGINATRLFSCLYKQTLNVGRVMTPTLAMVVMRDAAIRAFSPEAFYTVQLELAGCSVTSRRFKDRSEAEELLKSCQAEGSADILEVTRKAKTENPPLRYDLTSLQRDASRICGFTAQQTLDYLQSLYEKKVVTYPRTDSHYLTSDMKPNLVSLIHASSEKLGLMTDGTNLTAGAGRVINDSKVTDHHAILPTRHLKDADLRILSNGERKILTLVTVRAATAISPPCRYDETVIRMMCGGEAFSLKGRTVTDKGWRMIEEQLIPPKTRKKEPDTGAFREGSRIPIDKASLNEGRTSPPARYSEDTLLHSMETAGNGGTDSSGSETAKIPEDAERRGLGTSATRAGIIEKLVKKGFLARSRDKKKLLLRATDKGTALITVMPELIQSVALTADWEEKLLQIERGEYSPDRFMQEIEQMVTELVSTYEAAGDPEILLPSRRVTGKCPHCGSDIIETGKGWKCTGRDCRFMIWKENAYFNSIGISLTEKMAEDLISNGRILVNSCLSKKSGKRYAAVITLETGPDGIVHYSMTFPDKTRK